MLTISDFVNGELVFAGYSLVAITLIADGLCVRTSPRTCNGCAKMPSSSQNKLLAPPKMSANDLPIVGTVTLCTDSILRPLPCINLTSELRVKWCLWYGRYHASQNFPNALAHTQSMFGTSITILPPWRAYPDMVASNPAASSSCSKTCNAITMSKPSLQESSSAGPRYGLLASSTGGSTCMSAPMTVEASPAISPRILVNCPLPQPKSRILPSAPPTCRKSFLACERKAISLIACERPFASG